MSHNIAKERVFELDVLRFSAAVAVVFYHLTYRPVDGQSFFEGIGLITRFGYLGVNLFFMISGFVILWTAVGRTPAQFVISRFSRLYPIFWVAIAITVICIGSISGQFYDASRILANMTMVAGYLDQPYIDSVYWTLQVELKFYLLVFILLLLRQIENIDKWLIGWTVFSIAAYFVPVIGIISIHPYGPYFISGATLFLVWKDKLTKVRGSMLFICLILSLIETYSHTHGYIYEPSTGYAAISVIIVFGFYALMLAIALGHVRIGERQFLFKLAIMTYPLYLLHNELGKQIFNALSVNKFTALVIVLLLLFTVCYVLAMYVDRPLNKASNRILGKLYRRITGSAGKDFR